MRGTRTLIVAGLLVAGALTAGSAQGAVRIGPDLTPTPPSGVAGFGCQPAAEFNPCSYLNFTSSNPEIVARAPFSGVITTWRFRAGCCTDPQTVAHTITLRSYRPGVQTAGGYAYFVPDDTGPSFEIPPGNQVLSDPPTVLPARMRIDQGEMVGIDADNPIGVAVYNNATNVTMTVATKTPTYFGENYGSQYPYAAALNADLEPDADGDGFGDETQDCQPADPTQHEACPVPPSPSPPNPPAFVDPGGSCESNCGGGVVFSGPISVPPSGDGSKVYIPLKCPPTATQPCGGFLTLDTLKPKRGVVLTKQLAKARYAVRPGETEKVKLKLSKAGRKLLTKKGKLKVEITIDPNLGDSSTIRKTLKAPGD